MNEEHSLLRDAAERYFTQACGRAVLEAADRSDWQAALWAAVEDMGYAHPLCGTGLLDHETDLAPEYLVLAAAARRGAPLPLAETMLAGLLLRSAGLEVPPGPLSLVIGGLRADAEGAYHGEVKRVPYASQVGSLVVATDHAVAVLAATDCLRLPGRNLANEPRDQLRLHAVRPRQQSALRLNLDRVLERAALMRAAQMAAAGEQVLALAVDHAQQRKQFGKPIGSFQAIQHQLALAAGQVAAAKASVLAAYSVLQRQGPGVASGLAAAMAKSRGGEAAAQVAAIGHQVLGAMGFTQEHALHFATRRLQSWRSECGSEVWWQERIGRQVLAAGADGFWPLITATA